ncbi:DNA primase [Streptomyces sp. INA 01156]
MNRTALGLAVGAGYLLGRTKKLKMAVAVGGLVAGKMNLGPRMITDMVSTQLQKNPQFKELGDQLRGDLRGAGKAASGALVERQLDSLADKLHGRTTEMRDQLTGLGRPDREAEVDEDTEDDRRAEDDLEDEEATDGEPDDEEPEPAPERPAEKASSKRAPSKEAAKKTAKKAPARKAAPAKKPVGKKAAAARTTSSRGARTSKGGGER